MPLALIYLAVLVLQKLCSASHFNSVPNVESQLIDTQTALRTFLDGLKDCENSTPNLYVDLEGNDLCRSGTLSLVTILVESQQKVYIVDVTTLKHEAFTTSDSNGYTLKTILESPNIIKVFFDIRNDSDALFSHYGIRVDGIQDIQLMELALRRFGKNVVNGLLRCVEKDAPIGFAEKRKWNEGKNAGRKLFAPERGGSFAVFDQRPLKAELLDYCTQDVALMPGLRKVYRGRLWDAAWAKIEDETKARIRLSQSPGFNGKGRHMAEGPRTWSNWSPTAAERASRTLFVSSSTSVVAPTSTSSQSAEGVQITNAPTPSLTTTQPTESGTTRAPTSTELTATRSLSDVLSIAVHERGYTSPTSRGYSNDDEEDYGYGGYDGSYPSSEGSNDALEDFAACDIDCGYCGQCMY